MVFENRRQAGRLLARKLKEYAVRDGVLVLAIPRGGVVVGDEIAKILNVDLDVIVTKKIGAPDNSELAIGAVAEDGEAIFDKELIARLGVSKDYLRKAVEQVKNEKVGEYIKKFRGGRELDVIGKNVIVTDDGIATGRTVEAALCWLKTKKVKEIVLAVPTAAMDSLARIKHYADKVICLDKPLWFAAVGQFYKEFEQVSDEEVVELLKI